MTIEELIYQHAVRTPDKIAIIQGEMSVSYSELWKQAANSAERLKQLGMSKGNRIILSASKQIEFVYSYIGAHLAGLIVVPIDQETNSTRLERIVESAQPKMIAGKIHYHGNYNVVPFDDICPKEMNEQARFSIPKEYDIADLLYTTGTTGLPKGVALSYENEMAAAENINSFIRNTSEDVELMALPISHSFGLGRLRCVLSKGATLVLLGSFASMKKFYSEIERCNVTGFGMVPA